MKLGKSKYMHQDQLMMIIKKGLDNVSQTMRTHEGVDFVLKSRLKFEKWFQIELIKQILILVKHDEELQLFNEYPVSVKKSKKGETIDLAITINSRKLAAIELKIVPTNYEVPGFKKSVKGITDTINEMIEDLRKSINDGFIYSFSIGLVFPFPLDDNHRNNTKDFVKQESKLRIAGKLDIYKCEISEKFNSWYYILYN